MTPVVSYAGLESLGRQRLSHNFFMRDFLYSEIAAAHGLCNAPEFPDVALKFGRKLCTELLEPLHDAFGRIHIRSGYRSPLVNGFGNKRKMNCSSNESNFAGHIWDFADKSGTHGAMVCIVIPSLVDHIAKGGSWTDMAWWIHDHLNYSTLYFFPQMSAFNIGWHERPIRRIDSYAKPLGCLTKPGMVNHGGLHRDQYASFPDVASGSRTAENRALYGSPKVASRIAMSNGELPASTDDIGSTNSIAYRAIHVRNAWRKAFNHKSLEAAIHGVSGAAALFAGRARIDYAAHGAPLYVVVWQTGSRSGFVVRPGVAGVGLAIAYVPIETLLEFEEMGMADTCRLDAFFPNLDPCFS